MAAGSFLVQFRTNAKLFIKFAFQSRRKRKQPSPTTSFIFPDFSAKDVTQLDEKEFAFEVDLDPSIWREILSYCEVIDILHVGMTCRMLATITQDRRVWYFALLRICYNRRLAHLHFRIKSLSCATLRQKAILSTRLDLLSRGLDPRPFPYTTTTLSLPVSVVWGLSFLPGGEWLVALCRKGNKDCVMLCRTKSPLDQPFACLSVSGWNLTNMCVFTSDAGDTLLLLRSDRPNKAKLEVFMIHSLEGYPRLERLWAVENPEIENYAAMGSYVVYGWNDHSHIKPIHLIKVLRFGSCYRKLADHSLMAVEWEVGERLDSPDSYGLRISDSQITVVASSTQMVAAYAVPSMDPASVPSRPISVTPFWRFSCVHLKPRAVYLVPSLPAVDTPSVVILYGSRCLFIAPSFDTDPRHPTYFSTYSYPRELKRPMLLGPHRAFWELGRGRVGIGILPAPITPAFCAHGSWDMTGVHAPEGNLADDVHPLGHAGFCRGKLMRAAWDEESGKLAMCPRADSSLVIVVNVVPE